MSEQHLHGFPNRENSSLDDRRARVKEDDRPENISYEQAPALDSLHEPLHRFNLPSSPYDCFDTAGSLVNYQHAFQPLDFDPEYHMQAHPGVHPSNIYAPTGLFTSPIPGQPWIDEINPSYTPIGSEHAGWTPSDARSYGWLIDSTFANTAEQAVYVNTLNILPINQYTPLESTGPEPSPMQRSFSDTAPRLPLQHSFSARPASIALKVRNEKFKNDIATLLYENLGHNGHKPMRVSKAKKVDKADNNIKHEACWRCKRYRKACIGQDVCKECSTAGFRVWPSAIGCRRGAMEGFVEKIMPSHSVGILRELRAGVSRTSNWRKALYLPEELSPSPDSPSPADRWEFLKHKVQSTMVFGPEFAALVDVLAAYEHSQKTEAGSKSTSMNRAYLMYYQIPIWTQSITLLSSTCDFYHFFVAASKTEIQLPDLINGTIKLRKSLARSWDMFLKLCLSGRRENWFPAFLSAVLGICSMVILLDAVPSVPGSTRKAIWADIEAIVRDLRVRQYMMSLDLLRIGAKGINPLKLDCWVAEEEIDSEGQKSPTRNSKGMALLGQDSAAFDGFIALRQWHAKYKAAMLRGNDMWDSVPFTKSHTQAVAALSKVFEF